MKLIQVSKTIGPYKPISKFFWNKEVSDGDLYSKYYEYQTVDKKSKLEIEYSHNDNPHIDTIVVRIPKVYGNPNHNNPHKPHPLHSSKSVSFEVKRVYINIRIQGEVFHTGEKPWETIRKIVRQLILGGWLINPIKIEQRFNQEVKLLENPLVSSVEALETIIMENLIPYRIDWKRDYEEYISDFDIPLTSIEHYSTTSFYRKYSGSELKLYHKKVIDKSRFEVILKNCKAVKQLPTLTLRELDLHCRLYIIKKAITTKGHKSDKTFWLWVERFMFDNRKAVSLSKKKEYQVKRENQLRVYKEVIRMTLRGISYREISKKLGIGSKTISRVLN